MGPRRKISSDSIRKNEREIMKHCAKTIYFNDLWKGFLTKVSIGICVWIIAMMYSSFRNTVKSPHYGFELLSIVVVITTVGFLRRCWKPLLLFKCSFIFALLQMFWWMYVWYQKNALELRKIDMDISREQFPIGSCYFVFIWLTDRFMVSSRLQAEGALQEVRQPLKKDQ